MEDLRKKYQPQQTQLQNLAAEIDSLKKQLQAAPATLSDEEKASRAKTIDTKDKQYQRDSEDFQNLIAGRPSGGAGEGGAEGRCGDAKVCER